MRENLLLDFLPETVTVDGKEFDINSDFRSCIIIEKILNDNAISDKEKVERLLDVFYVDEKPDNIEKAVMAFVDFYKCGNEVKQVAQKKNGNVPLKQPATYSFDYDAPYIYAAFLAQYRIDLNEIEYLHWWKFKALFLSLEDHNKIMEIISYRAADLGKIKDKDERARIARLKQIYALPQTLSLEDKVAMAGAAFGGALV